MARWVRRMRQVDGYEERFSAYLNTLGPQPSRYRVARLARILRLHHVVIGRGMFGPISRHDELHYGSSVRRQLLDEYGDDRP